MNVERRATLSACKMAKRERMQFTGCSVHLVRLLGTGRACSRIGPFIFLFGGSWVLVSLAGGFVALHRYIFSLSNDRDNQ